MWYFAYGSNLNARAVNQWFRDHGQRGPTLVAGKPAVLDNYRLGFTVYSEYWGGGMADIAYDPGKWVMGVLFELTEADLALMDRKVGRRVGSTGREEGLYGRVEVKVSPLGKGAPVKAVTYAAVSVDRFDIPPTQRYMEMVVQGACAHGLSSMWLEYLRTFTTQIGREPRAAALEPERATAGATDVRMRVVPNRVTTTTTTATTRPSALRAC